MHQRDEATRLTMQPQGGSLLAQIEQDVLDDEKPLGAALRSGAEKMHAAGQSYRVVTAACVGNLDLKGYPVRAEVPEYRVVHAGLHIDAVTSTAVIESQPIGPR